MLESRTIPGLPQDTVPLGDVTNYYSRRQVIAILVRPNGTVKLGDTIFFVRKDTNEWDSRKVDSIQENCRPIQIAKGGQHIGIFVGVPVEKKSTVYFRPQSWSNESSFVK